MNKIIRKLVAFAVSVVVIFEGLLPVTAEEAIEEPDNLYALSACLMDAESGRILFAKDADTRRANASTTKIMTLIVTLERADLADIVTVSEYAAGQPDVQLNAAAGEQFYLKDLCFSLMLESHNDSAVAIAEHVAGSVEQFAAYMNEKAREIGCKDTHFVTPNGLDKEDAEGFHGTTASDLARIMSYCILESPQRETFLAITQTPSYSFSDVDGKRSFSCTNHNAFLTMMDGVLSGKTGFTGNAGYCYVGALQRDERVYVVALLGCGWPNNKTYKWSDSRKLMQYGIDAFSRVKLTDTAVPEQAFSDIPVSGAQTEQIHGMDAVGVECIEDEAAPASLLLRQGEEIQVVYEREEQLQAPVGRGEPVGYIEYRLQGEVLRRDVLVTDRDVEAADLPWNMQQVLQRFLF